MSERTISFDAHRFVKRLVESGLAEETAEVLADEQSRLLTDNLATKNELDTGLAAVRADLEVGLAGVRADLETGLTDVRADFEKGLAATEARLMRWMAGLLIAQGGVIVTLISVLG
ncbi:MAG: hypothetical protein ACON4V_07365 [Parvibaculales bacterium]